MRRRLPRSVALPAAAALLLFSAAPANADPTYPTTPIPQPAHPGQAPISAPTGPQPLGQAVGDAGTALGIIRLLPNAVPTSTILPGFGQTLPKQSALEAGMGLSNASANSDAYLSYEKAIAQASPFGLSVGGNAPQTPGSVVQTALPDNPQPISGGLNAPSNPLLNVGLLNGSAHARWSETLGPCVDTIADASTSVASLSLLNVIPSMPNLGLDALKPKLDPGSLAKGFDLTKGLQSLGGLLQGGGQTAANGTGSLLSLPNTLSSRSQVKLVDIPGSKNKAVQSTSTLQAADIEILKGTPLALSVKVVSQPTLKVTSTGDAKTSKVDYTAPPDAPATDGVAALRALEAARVALAGVRAVLPRLSGHELARAMCLADAVKSQASATQVLVTTEAAHRGEFVSARRGLGSAHEWVREHAPSMRQAGAGQLAAFATEVAHCTPAGAWSAAGPRAGAYADPERAEGVVWARVVTGEIGVALATAALTEVARLRDRLEPDTVPTVATAILDHGVRSGSHAAKSARSRLLAMYGLPDELDRHQGRLRKAAHLSSPQVHDGDVTGYDLALTPEQSAILK
jgi:hypothetical protein